MKVDSAEQPANEIPGSLSQRFKSDPFANYLNFELSEATPGYALVTAKLTEDTLNFAGSTHGGLVFSLADFAFAAASNGHGRLAVATSVSIQFYTAAKAGDTLFAEACEQQLTHRAGFYEMTVTNQSGAMVAKCLGMVHRSERSWFE